MSASTNVVPLRGRELACPECVFRNECLARDNGRDGAPGRCDITVVPRIAHRGDHLFRTGEAFEAVHMVRSGAIKTYVILKNGEEQVIGFHTAGELVGLDAIEQGHHVCNAVVLDTSSVCALPFDQLCRMSAGSPAAHRRLIGAMSRKIVHHEGLLLILGQKTAEQRMAAFLLHQSRRQRQLGLSPSEINLPMSRADIASYLALAVETVSRVLTRLQDAGILRVQRSRIDIVDLAGLALIAEETMEDAQAPERLAAPAH